MYTTRTRVPRKRPDTIEICAEQQSYVTALTTAERFGWLLWAEACRRGVTDTTEVVVIGDGAHWIWNLASEHFPTATQILDWYHASAYIWNAATAISGESNVLRTTWAQQQRDCLWEGNVAQVLRVLEGYRAKGAAVTDAICYYTTHQARIDYPAYRARGLQTCLPAGLSLVGTLTFSHPPRPPRCCAPPRTVQRPAAVDCQTG